MKFIKYIIILVTLVSPSLLRAQTFMIPDTNFRACLINSYPNVIDANKNLIISEAKSVTGILKCTDYNIKSIAGFEYFENITEVFFDLNAINQVIALPPNNVLTRLVFDDNQLSSLPDMSKLTAMRTFAIRRNSFTEMPDISASTKINRLYLKSNAIKVLPDISKYKGLLNFDVSWNLLTTLPKLDSLKLLQELVANDNLLTELPSLLNQTELTKLDVSGNKLTQLPPLAADNVISSIDIEGNLFKNLPDFTVYPKLKRAYLNNNYFTFSNLVALEKIPGYDTIFPISVQHSLTVGKEISIREKDLAYISTGVDLNVPGVIKTWYFNGNQIQKSNSDSLKVLSDTVLQSGWYYCVLSKPEFPNLFIKTDSFKVTITACELVNTFNVAVQPNICEAGGKVKVMSNQPLSNGFIYKLVAADGQQLTSFDGSFTGLATKKYALYGQQGNCKKIIDANVLIEEEACEGDYFTPDGDGQHDTYFFSETGTVTITDKFGNKVKSFSIPEKWDGLGLSGKVAPGLYYANINNGTKILKITIVY